MTGILVSQPFMDRYAGELQAKATAAGLALEPLILSNEIGAKLDEALLPRIELAFNSSDLYRGNARGFYEAAVKATNLRWLHLFGVGIDPANHGPLLARGVRVTNSVGVNAEPIAQTAITGLLMLSRGFPGWMESQRDSAWRPVNYDSPKVPQDLSAETMVLIGVGAIGSRIAQLAQALGLRVIGVRRSAQRGDEPVDEMVMPADLDRVLPQANWLVLAPVLTPETRGMIDARRIALLPRGARVINVSRGLVIDEAAMIEALHSGHLGGAYLDVFSKEPLPPESPLWLMPNVILTPHNSAVSSGKYQREADLFFENLTRWGNGQPLVNEVSRD